MVRVSITKCQDFIMASLFMVVVFFLTRQVPFINYSSIMNIALVLFFLIGIRTIVINVKKKNDAEFVFYINTILLLFLVLYSLLQDNSISLILRFYVILFLIVSAYYVEPKKIYVDIFLFFILLQALFVIGIELYLFINSDAYLPLRYLIRSSDWGDVYKFTDQFLWRVQTRGNALLPFAFFTGLVYLSGRKRLILCSIYLIAILFAGNFAFILGLIFFLTLYILLSIRWSFHKIVGIMFVFAVIGCITGKPVFQYLERTIEIKSTKSNPTRLDQTEVLINDLSHDTKSMLLGRGLGNTISEKTYYRDYTGDIYFELQSLYILNQVGFLYFSLFILLNILLAIYLMRHKLLLAIYLSYIFYAFFNPYLLDTSHIAAIIILISMKESMHAKQKKDLCNNSCLQS